MKTFAFVAKQAKKITIGIQPKFVIFKGLFMICFVEEKLGRESEMRKKLERD